METMTSQEIFDTVLSFLRKQGIRSFDADTNLCLYRSSDGRKCAVGCLVPDEFYNAEMEGGNINRILDPKYKIDPIVVEFVNNHFLLLEDLQMAHDDDMPIERSEGMHSWEHAMARIASYHRLTYNPPTED